MSGALFLSILGSGFAVAFLHGALPTHWLPFVLVGQRQGWSRRRTLAVTAAAGLGHVLVTMALGALLIASGQVLGEHWGERWAAVLPRVAGALLMLLGVYYLWRHILGGGDHVHGGILRRLAPADGPPAGAAAAVRLSDRSAVAGLLVILALSPCEAFLPIYLSGAVYGWAGFGLLSLVLAAASILSMTGLTALSMAGARWLGLKAAERYEGALLGGLLMLLGLVVLVTG